MSTGDAIHKCFESPNVCDSNGENANIVDVLSELSRNANRIANAITPSGVAGNNDETGVFVASLTESVMGLTASMCKIADALNSIADAIRERSTPEA